MSNQLILMRHAKSDHDDPSLSDHDRPLSSRGVRDSPRMALWLQESGLVPDLILCSTSQRTCETAELMVREWGRDVETRHLPQLYLSSPQTMLEAISSDHEEAARVMVLAHNPGTSMLASFLADQNLEMVTAALAVFDVGDWYALGTKAGRRPEGGMNDCQLTQFVSPKTLP